jgi:hypothetical protein
MLDYLFEQIHPRIDENIFSLSFEKDIKTKIEKKFLSIIKLYLFEIRKKMILRLPNPEIARTMQFLEEQDLSNLVLIYNLKLPDEIFEWLYFVFFEYKKPKKRWKLKTLQKRVLNRFSKSIYAQHRTIQKKRVFTGKLWQLIRANQVLEERRRINDNGYTTLKDKIIKNLKKNIFRTIDLNVLDRYVLSGTETNALTFARENINISLYKNLKPSIEQWHNIMDKLSEEIGLLDRSSGYWAGNKRKFKEVIYSRYWTHYFSDIDGRLNMDVLETIHNCERCERAISQLQRELSNHRCELNRLKNMLRSRDGINLKILNWKLVQQKI